MEARMRLHRRLASVCPHVSVLRQDGCVADRRRVVVVSLAPGCTFWGPGPLVHPEKETSHGRSDSSDRHAARYG